MGLDSGYCLVDRQRNCATDTYIDHFRSCAVPIGGAIATRFIMAYLRAGIGQKNMEGITGGPAPFAKADRSRFLQALDEALARLG
jgi:Uncharacterized BCR, YaiI/YqxD family COG1671